MIIADHWFPRLLHALREIEIDLRRARSHNPDPGLDQVAEDVAVLRTVLEHAIEDAK